MKIQWILKKFDALTNLELYALLRLRSEVFIVEQNCAFQDLDGKDIESLHLLGMNGENELIAYARILPKGISYKEFSIGRVVTSPKVRGNGVGKELMNEAIIAIKDQFGEEPIRIGAQYYLKKFYEDFGFKIASAEYLEDNIPHVEMVLSNETHIR